MQTAYTTALITAVPSEDVVLVAVMFLLAAVVLFALAVEAGNYPRISAGIRRARSALQRLRNHRWHGESVST